MCNECPPLLRYLSEELGYRVRTGETTLGYALFYIDLSRWKLQLSHQTPVIWARRSDLEETSPRHLVESLQDVGRERGFRDRTLLVILDGDSKPLLRDVPGLLHNLVVIGAGEQEAILHSRRPTGELLGLISAQVPISSLAPYEISSPVTGSRFFGREYEIRRIIGNIDTNYAILGIRRIGKTSLLREIQRRLVEQEDPPPIVYLDCSDLLSLDDYIREVVRKLNPKELPRLHLQQYAFFFPNFLERMRRKYGDKIIFFLDEIDNLVIMQRRDWKLFRMLRASSSKGACQYIIAGFREAMQEQYLLDSPFFNFAQPTRLNEFTIREAHNLIVTPMENLRVRFRNKQEVVGRIYEETAGQPNLIQYYCMILLKHLDQTGEREISPDSLIDVYGNEDFKGHLLTTFMLNTSNREKALVYALLGSYGRRKPGPFSQAHLDLALKGRDVTLTQAAIDEACNNLVLAGVFYRKGRDYYFASPVFPRMLQQNYDVDYLFHKVKEEGI
jgi:hypothetical protein